MDTPTECAVPIVFASGYMRVGFKLILGISRNGFGEDIAYSESLRGGANPFARQ